MAQPEYIVRYNREVGIDFEDSIDDKRSFKLYCENGRNFNSWDASAQDAIADKYLELHNEEGGYREEGERFFDEETAEEGWFDCSSPVLTREQFKAKLVLVSMFFYENSSVTLSYEDGGMFAGHGFVVSSDGPNFTGKLHASMLG